MSKDRDWGKDWQPGDDDRPDDAEFFTGPDERDPVEQLCYDSREFHTLSLRDLEVLLHSNGYREQPGGDHHHKPIGIVFGMTKDGKTVELDVLVGKRYEIHEMTEDVILADETEQRTMANMLMLMLGTHTIVNHTTEHFRNWAFGLMRRHDSLHQRVISEVDQMTARNSEKEMQRIRLRLERVMAGTNPYEGELDGEPDAE